MCSGKSRVGRALAKKRGWPFYDTDEMITSKVGASVADIIKSRGESAFRAVERETVRLVGVLDNCVVSTGGGVPMDPANMEDLRRNGWVVWLKVRPETVLRRAGNLASRPLIDPANPLKSIEDRLSARELAYAQSDFAVDTDDSTPDQIAEIISQRLSEVQK